MQSRMKKYYDGKEIKEETTLESRSSKNKKLYKEVGNLEIENFDSNSNASVLGESTNAIDIDKVKDMLDKKYKETPRKKSMGDTTQINLPKINLDETREYDINAILKKAKESKEFNYEEDRLKKLNKSQYDILKDLNLEEENDDEEDLEVIEDKSKRKAKEDRLKELIEEADNEEANAIEDSADLALDILSDLKGDDEDTRVMGALDLEEKEEEIDTISDDEEELAKTLDIDPVDEEEFGDSEFDDEENESDEESRENDVDDEPIIKEITKDEDENNDEDEVLLPESDEDKSQTISLDELFEEEDEIEKTFRTDKILKKDKIPKVFLDEEDEDDEHTKTELLLADDSLEKTKEDKYFTKTEDLFHAAAVRKKSKKSILENSFVGENAIKEEDFDDFEDLKDGSSFGRILIKVLITVIILAVLFGIIYFVSEYFGFNLFS